MSVNGVGGNTMRLTGMVTGMDTDETVRGMTLGYQMKIDKQYQNKQINQWRQDMYREIIKDSRDFYDKYFEVGSKDSIFGAGNFATSKITSSDSAKVDATALPGAKSGTYKVEVTQKAENSKIVGTGLNLSQEIADKNSWKNGQITINGEAITLGNTDYALIDNLRDDINSKIAASAVKGKVQAVVAMDGGKEYIRFDALTDDEVKIESTTITDIKNLENRVINSTKSTTLGDLGMTDAESLTFKIKYTDESGQEKTSQEITINKDDTIEDAINKIYGTKSDDAVESQQTYLSKDIEIGFSELTRSLTINTRDTGSDQSLEIMDMKFIDNSGKVIGEAGSNPPDVPSSNSKYIKDIFGISGAAAYDGAAGITGSQGQDAIVKITPPGGSEVTVIKHSNDFDIDGIEYNIKDTTVGTVELNVSSDTDEAFDKIKTFIDDYNKIIDNIYEKIEEKKQYSYKPLTEEQKEGMEKEDIERWEDKAKGGLLKNDIQLQNFVYKLRSSFFESVKGAGVSVSEIGLNTSADTTKRGHIEIDEAKLRGALETRGDQVKKLLTNSVPTFSASTLDSDGSFDVTNWQGKNMTFKIGDDEETITLPAAGITEANLEDKINEAIQANAKLKDKISVRIDTTVTKQIYFTAETEETVEITATDLGINDKDKLLGMEILNKDANSGVFTKMKDIFRSNVKTFDGPLLKKAGYKGTISENNNTLSKAMKQKEKSMKELQSAMYKKQDYYYKMFARLETAMNQLNAQMDALLAQTTG